MESVVKRHQPLYLKYRPLTLSGLVGQEAVTRTLSNAISYKRLSHAYLFTGPRGTGKTSTARILAKSLNCLSSDEPLLEPCLSCTCCDEIAAGTSPAVLEIDAASNNSVDDARVLIERAPLKAVGGRFKVYIIDECHMLTKEAFNALLKTIEQPPPGVVFILATTEEHKVLPTIVSRCQRLLFRLVNEDVLRGHLEKIAAAESIEIEPEALSLVARRSGGGLRDALGHLDQASLLSSPGQPATVEDLLRLIGALDEDVLLELSSMMHRRDGGGVLEAINKLISGGREPAVIVSELSRHFLFLMKASYLGGDHGASPDSALAKVIAGSSAYLAGLSAQCRLFERAELSQIVEALDRLEQTCRRTTQPAMHLEIGLLSICHRHDMLLLRELAQRVAQLEALIEGGAAPVKPLSDSPPKQIPARAREGGAGHTGSQSLGAEPAGSARAAIFEQGGKPVSTSQVPSHKPSYPPEPEQVPASLPAPALAQPDAPAPDTRPAASAGSEVDSDPPQAKPIDGIASEPGVFRAPENASDAASEPEKASGDESGRMEELWSQILAELHRRSLPAFSLISTHGFPLSISPAEITVGVSKDNFQKMIEGKAEHLKSACQVVLGTSPNVRVRVGQQKMLVGQSTGVALKAPARVDAGGRPSEPRRATGDAVADEPGTPELPQEEDSNRETRTSPSSASSGERIASLSPDEVDSTTAKEAYKLFEGPGSRRIQ